ncbi:MAG: glycosyltransferase [Ignavibacteria bacterium]|nr:glycosyltransferase [Ignavibacteria bacterium]
MLPLVKTPTQKLEKYKDLISEQLFNEIIEISKDLKGLKVFHVNATPRGGGVAEILKSLVPLMKGVGLKADWYTIPPRNNFFEITKRMHNALQGKKYQFPFSARKKYMLHMARTAELMWGMKPDIWVIHDPQPAGVAMFLPNFHPAVSRLHIDFTSPDEGVWKFVASFLELYDKIVLSSKDFVKERIKEKAVVFQPAIDPLNPKNQPLLLNNANEILRNFGINPDKPLITQVSRFDPWKDPLGVIEAYQLAKKKIPDLQLALVGLFLARDDPEAERVYNKVKKKAEKDQDIFLFAEVEKLGSLKVHVFVNAIQVASDVILQKSIREGFGLTIAEAMWKEKPVIGGNVGGIKFQIEDGKNGFLVSNPKEAAVRIIQLIKNPELSKKMGKEAKKTVTEKFLIPRLLRDYLKLFKQLV